MNQRKKWCECCKVMIPFNRSAIQDHEASHKHKRAHEKALKDAHFKARKEHKNFSKEEDYFHKNDTINPTRKKAGPPAKPEAEEVPVADFQTTEQLIDAPMINDQEQFMGGQLWVIEKEDDTSRLRFRNTLTGQLKYDRPVGLMLEDFEEEAWAEFEEEYKRNPNKFSRDHKLNIGEWEEVKPGEGFFDKQRAELSDESENNEAQQSTFDKIEQKIVDGVLTSRGEIVKELILQGESESNFGSRLRDLASKDIDLSLGVPQLRQQARSPPRDTGKLFKKRVLANRTTLKLFDEE